MPATTSPLRRLLLAPLATVVLLASTGSGRDALARGPTDGPSPRREASSGRQAEGGRDKGAKGDKSAKGDKGERADRGDKAGGKGEKGGKGAKGKKKRRRGGVPLNEPKHHTPSLSILQSRISCPPEMVAVAGRFCIDRYEASLVEVETHEPLSPYYPPSPKLLAWSLEHWAGEREKATDDTLEKTMPLPPVPAFELQGSFKMKAMSWPAAVPSGYMSGEHARQACDNAGKRLCKETEWVTACRGEKQTTYPYGAKYRQDACNVFREDHPGHILHGDFSNGLTDPRLNQIELEGKPLLRTTGASPACVSRWGDDEIYDMVGNLDEWVDDPEGTFVGGFYARSTRNGCDARVRNHPVSYFDYSTGVRCCKDPG